MVAYRNPTPSSLSYLSLDTGFLLALSLQRKGKGRLLQLIDYLIEASTLIVDIPAPVYVVCIPRSGYPL